MQTFYFFENKNFSFNVTKETTEITKYTFNPDGFIGEQDQLKYFYNKVPKDENVNIIDVGAQSGLYTLYAKFLPNCKFFAFEPFKPSYDLLNDNIKLNNINNVDTFNIGLSNEKGITTLYTSADHNGLHTLGNNPLRFNDIVPINIEVDTIDNLFYEKGIPVYLIKIDTEGWELNILKGAIKTIKKYKPFIQIEFNPTNMKQCNISPIEVQDFISNVLEYENEYFLGEELLIKPKNNVQIGINIPTYQEYIDIIRSDYKYNPIDIDVSFYGLFSYQPQAWDYVLQTVREHFKNEKIILINDGFDQYDYSEMAKKYNCIHLKKEKETCLHWPDIESAYEYLHRVKEVCDIVKTEWVIQLHPDVICQGKISYLPNAHLAGVMNFPNCKDFDGQSANKWNYDEWVKIPPFINKYKQNVELNGWGFCGGSIMHVPSYHVVYDSIFGTNRKFNLEMIEEVYKKAREHDDTLFSILFALNGFVYRVWKDNPEYLNGNKNPGAFLHKYKEHYDFKSKNWTDKEYFEYCIKQNTEKRIKN